jgi:selenocysteine lyase/cysteine desulfurase
MWDQEYGSNLHPWREAAKKAGAKLVLVQSGPGLATPAERLLAAVTPRTRALAFSWVQFQTGSVTDLKAVADFARGRGIWTVVDAIQGVGARPLDLKALGLDAVCGGSHKWLVSPVGVGYLAVRPERLEELAPLAFGASTFGTCDDPVSLVCAPKAGAGRLEPGSRQVLEITALGASVELLLAAGLDEIERESRRLARRLREGLRAKGRAIHSPDEGAIVSFSADDAAARELKKTGVAYAVRGPGLRLSPHAFNTEEDVDRALACL